MITTTYADLPGIIICDQNDCDYMACVMRAAGLKAQSSPPEAEPWEESALHQEWICGGVKILCAPTATTYSRQDLRFVFFASPPNSIEQLMKVAKLTSRYRKGLSYTQFHFSSRKLIRPDVTAEEPPATYFLTRPQIRRIGWAK